ncbi:MAG: sialate O-acetylesterase [Sedimentisphaerales bacterium]|nr:sialate O-acetylesterase [Sedimentisphaerales bacterium]
MKRWIVFSAIFALLSSGCSDLYSHRQKFHLYILAGQSNMAGRGKVEEQDIQPHPRVFVLDKEGQWKPATEPLHFDKPQIAGVGPGLAFGKAMAEYKKNVKIGLIPCAAGGSPIASWTEGGYHSQTKSHPYDDALERTRIAMQSGVIKGIIWHQGESDSKPELAKVYQVKLEELIANFRRELGDDDLPFVVGKLSDFYIARNPNAKTINEIFEELPLTVQNTAYVETSGLTPKSDQTHFNAESARELGRRYAEKMIELEQED